MQVNMLDAKNRLSSLVVAAEQGEEIILARGGIPVARIIKYEKPKVKPPGAWKGLVRISRDWNSTETNATVEELFYAGMQQSTRPNAGRRAMKKSPAKK